ncbi:SDR family NAD(P)-dependent oxidoreductase [Arthrobacter bambusae]|uniref:SDR family NAD(P)-dependent oxidoreductase n=1 Tax=Arthrobacter bambusae TaxID=1338426 RepID=UPI00277D1C05|nr:SDR family NAD(P)-dependent oxidoreductase [Arthrobacter bambusae]MDQ0031789.1 NAD(P)-dependent dehydrogenase (short-subunit alcohol dehydrogenase family) [Arthrobacter bambusae]MDQ0099933.1 NAD(P)-dependent dehydrogenase (short-subunit alcohol dehydrogenase family) [Arthrobacter bambusae]
MTTADHVPPLSGKVALVTGASRGIGAEIATALVGAGAHVVFASRDSASLSQHVDAVTSAGGHAVAMTVDVGNEESVKALMAQVRDRFGRLDAAVNNAAGGGRTPAPLADWSSAEFDSTISVNLRGVFLCLKYEIELMLASGNGGAIVNMSSTAGEQGVAGLSGYVASKFGVGGLTRVAALDYAAQGIRVNAIAPGPILTERLAGAGQAAQDRVAAAVPLGRIGSTADVAAAALWLCSEQSSFVTGTVLAVDGGRLAGTPAFNTSRKGNLP